MGPESSSRRMARQSQLLDAAAACFAERGYGQTRTADITARAGLSSGLLFHYFASKRDVLLALLEREADEVSGIRVPRTQRAARSVLKELLAEVCRLADDPIAGGLAMEISALARRDPDVAAGARHNDERLRDVLGRLAVAGGTSLTADEAGTRLALIVDGLYSRVAVQDGYRALDHQPALVEMSWLAVGWSA